MSEGEDNHDFPCRGSSDDQGAQETLLGPDIVKRKTFFQGISFDEIPDFVGRRSLQAAMIDIYHFVEQSRHMKS